ncbi:MAG: VTT domain-containing protein [Candidatus Niyogibacteria bacterium]|nr:MAG: VTT domain-containing protein [Candidatus Niyogibacteria bacterium]
MIKIATKIFVRGGALILIIIAVFYLAQIARENGMVRELVADYGYFGIFAVAVLSGFNLAVPVPAVAFLPLFIGAGLNFWITIILITVGVTLADSFTYIVGRLGREIIDDKRKAIVALERVGERHKWAPMILLFLFSSIVPLPNEILVMPLGFLNYKFKRIWPVILTGNFAFNALYSTGVINLFEIL